MKENPVLHFGKKALSKELLDDYRSILREENGIEVSEDEAKEMAENMLCLYSHIARVHSRS